MVYSRELCAALERHGGKYAAGKRFSKAVMDLPPQRQKLAVDTYYRGDGSIGHYGPMTTIRCNTLSRTLAFQLQEMLARRGIFAYMNIRAAHDERMKDGRVIRHSTQYRLYYCEKTRGRRALRRYDYFLVPVRVIERQPYDGFVYNFETASEPHSYLVKGFAVHNCTAPQRDENQLHAAVVELVALDDAFIKYSTVQNWYPGDEKGVGGIYNFVTKRGECRGTQLAHLLDAGRDRLGHHLEVPELRAARRRLDRRVLLGGDGQQLPAGRHRHQDDPYRARHAQHHRLQGHLGRSRPEHLPRAGAGSCRAPTARATSPSATRC